jgi:hypothetical protein
MAYNEAIPLVRLDAQIREDTTIEISRVNTADPQLVVIARNIASFAEYYVEYPTSVVIATNHPVWKYSRLVDYSGTSGLASKLPLLVQRQAEQSHGAYTAI